MIESQKRQLVVTDRILASKAEVIRDQESLLKEKDIYLELKDQEIDILKLDHKGMLFSSHSSCSFRLPSSSPTQTGPSGQPAASSPAKAISWSDSEWGSTQVSFWPTEEEEEWFVARISQPSSTTTCQQFFLFFAARGLDLIVFIW
jgi:hypothetical protein